jgi:protein with PEP-CTERM/exosortase system signal
MKTFTLKFSGLATSLLIGFNAFGDTVFYDSYTTSYTPLAVGNNQQIGNEITAGYNATLTGFSFEYYTPSGQSQSSGVTVDLEIYANNGPLVNGYSSPGTLLYNSGFTSLPTPEAAGVDLNYTVADFGLNFVLPKDFTFTLTFQGLNSANVIDLLGGAPPTGYPGSTTPDYWYNTNSPASWQLLTLGASKSDIGAEFIVKAPDASATAGLLGLALTGMFVVRRKFATNQV